MLKKVSKYLTTFNRPIYFQCLPSCGLCCTYRVAVSESDLERIAGIGKVPAQFLRDSPQKREKREGARFLGALEKREGNCLFLNESRRCNIYPYRPSSCRSFPFYVEEEGEIDVDLSCPGIGRGNSVKEEFLGEIIEEEERFGKKEGENLALGEEIAQARRGYISPDALKEKGDSIDLEDIGNYNYKNYFGNLFQIEGLNIHLKETGTPLAYNFQMKGEDFKIDQNSYSVSNSISLSPLEEKKKRDYLVDYLGVWFRRRLLHRLSLVISLSLISSPSMEEVASAFIKVLINHIFLVEKALSLHWEKYDPEAKTETIFPEAIRALDGRIRSKCKEFQIKKGGECRG